MDISGVNWVGAADMYPHIDLLERSEGDELTIMTRNAVTYVARLEELQAQGEDEIWVVTMLKGIRRLDASANLFYLLGSNPGVHTWADGDEVSLDAVLHTRIVQGLPLVLALPDPDMMLMLGAAEHAWVNGAPAFAAFN